MPIQKIISISFNTFKKKCHCHHKVYGHLTVMFSHIRSDVGIGQPEMCALCDWICWSTENLKMQCVISFVATATNQPLVFVQLLCFWAASTFCVFCIICFTNLFQTITTNWSGFTCKFNNLSYDLSFVMRI